MVETLRIIGALGRASIRSYSANPITNGLRTLGTASVLWAEAYAVTVLLDRFGGIGGWTTGEVLVLLGVADAGLGIGMLLGESLEPPEFSQLLRDGRFDQALTRPMAPLLWVMATDVQVRNVGRVVAGVSILTAGLVLADVTVGPVDVALLLLGVAAMATTILSILVIGASITMWTIEGTEVLNAFTYGGAVLAGWPMQIYASALRAVFVWLVPVGVAVYVPALWVLDRSGPAGAGRGLLPLVPLLVAAFCGVAGLAWRGGVARYRGAGG